MLTCEVYLCVELYKPRAFDLSGDVSEQERRSSTRSGSWGSGNQTFKRSRRTSTLAKQDTNAVLLFCLEDTIHCPNKGKETP